MKTRSLATLISAGLLCIQAGLQAGTITFAKYEGMAKNSPIPTDPPPPVCQRVSPLPGAGSC